MKTELRRISLKASLCISNWHIVSECFTIDKFGVCDMHQCREADVEVYSGHRQKQLSAENIIGWSERQQKLSVILLVTQGGSQSRNTQITQTFLHINADQPHPEDNKASGLCVNANS